jgi:hypothetical protein
MKAKNKYLLILIAISFCWISFLIVVNQSKYPLAGDALLHWREAKEIMNKKSLDINNVIYPKAPFVGAPGFPLLNVEISAITGLSLGRVFILLPILLIVFYFLVIYLFSNAFTNNKLISVLSSLSFLFFFINFNKNSMIYDYIFAKGAFLAAFLIFLFVIIFLNYKKKQFVPLLLISLVIATLHRAVALCFLIFIFILILFLFFKSIRKSELKVSYSNQYSALIIFAMAVIIILSLMYLPTLLKNITNLETKDSISGNLMPKVKGGLIDIKLLNDFFISPYFNLTQGSGILSLLLFILGLFFLIKYCKIINHKFLLISLIFVLLLGFFLQIRIINQDYARILFPFYYSLAIGSWIFFINKLFKSRTNAAFALIFAIFFLFFFQGLSSFHFELFDLSKSWNISEGAMSFLSTTPENSLIVADQYTGYFLTTALSREIIATYPGHGGSYVDNFYNLMKRRTDIRDLYHSCDINETLKILKEYEANRSIFIYSGYLEKAHYKTCESKFENYFEKIDFGSDKIYYLDNLTFI